MVCVALQDYGMIVIDGTADRGLLFQMEDDRTAHWRGLVGEMRFGSYGWIVRDAGTPSDGLVPGRHLRDPLAPPPRPGAQPVLSTARRIASVPPRGRTHRRRLHGDRRVLRRDPPAAARGVAATRGGPRQSVPDARVVRRVPPSRGRRGGRRRALGRRRPARPAAARAPGARAGARVAVPGRRPRRHLRAARRPRRGSRGGGADRRPRPGRVTAAARPPDALVRRRRGALAPRAVRRPRRGGRAPARHADPPVGQPLLRRLDRIPGRPQADGPQGDPPP